MATFSHRHLLKFFLTFCLSFPALSYFYVVGPIVISTTSELVLGDIALFSWFKEQRKFQADSSSGVLVCLRDLPHSWLIVRTMVLILFPESMIIP